MKGIFSCIISGFGSADIRNQAKRKKRMNGVNGRWLERIRSLPLTFQVSTNFYSMYIFAIVKFNIVPFLICFVKRLWNVWGS